MLLILALRPTQQHPRDRRALSASNFSAPV
jgi:hypothetical protein